MTSHRLKLQRLRTNRLGVHLTSFGDHAEITFGFLAGGWLKSVKRLEALGYEAAVSLTGRTAKVKTNATIKTIQEVLKGYRSKKMLLVWFLAPISALGLLAFKPVYHVTKKATHKAVQVIDFCSTQSLESWLISGSGDTTAELLESSSMGGVTAGLLECNGKRYSYTLELKEPKRVLKLERLDS